MDNPHYTDSADALAPPLLHRRLPSSAQNLVNASKPKCATARAASLRADISVNHVRISNDALAQGAKAIKRVELPTGEDGLGRVAAKALLVGTDGRETWTWVQAQVEASVPTVVAARALTRGCAAERCRR